MSIRTRALMFCGAAALSLLAATVGHASSVLTTTNHLTFSGAVRLPGVTLARGAYTFELHSLNPSIVRVTSRDGSRLFYRGFVQGVRRPAGMDPGRTVALGEAPRGVAPPILAWYPIGAATGHEFMYPGR